MTETTVNINIKDLETTDSCADYMIISEPTFDNSLQGRKNGKIQMELVETGFPNAMLALGKVMTWAAEYKGYEPNDWKQLPNAKLGFLGAASRHRCERMKGDIYDDESNLLHLIHEAFNVMAELEVTLMEQEDS